MNEPILDSMHKIRIEYVRGIVPKSVYNRLKKLRIATIGDLNDLDRNEYIDLQCNHPLNLSKFDDFMEQITAAPESVILHFISWYHEDIKNTEKAPKNPVEYYNSQWDVLIELVLNSPIELFADLIPKSVYNRLRKLEIKTIREFKDLDRGKYIKLQCNHPINLGKFDELKDICENKTSLLLGLVLKSARVSDSVHSSTDLISIEDTNEAPGSHASDKVELALIREVIPKSVYNRLQKLGVVTIGQLKDLARSDYIELQCSHPKSLNRFDELQRLCRLDPQLVIQHCKQQEGLGSKHISHELLEAVGAINTIVDEVLDQLNRRREKIDSIQIKYVQGLFSKSVFNRCRELGIDTLGELRTLTEEEYLALESNAPNSLRRFRNIKESIDGDSVALIQHARNPNHIKWLPQQLYERIEFAELIKSIFVQYYQHIDKPRDRLIVYKKYGLDESRCYTLEEIGSYLGLTRERVRQILEQNLKNLQNLFLGAYLTKYQCECDPAALRQINEFLINLKQSDLVERREIELRCGVNVKDRQYLKLFLELMGIPAYCRGGMYLYLVHSPLSLPIFEKLVQEILNTLKQAIIPISSFDLTVRVKRNQRYTLVPNSFLDQVFSLHPNIETIKNEDGVHSYQITLLKLNSVHDQAYRILYEKQQSMHFRDIHREISHRLALTHSAKRQTVHSVNSGLAKSDHIVPAGKSGYWSLKEWGLSNKSILELIIQALQIFNRPCSSEEICNQILERRPFIKEQTIKTLLGANKSLFHLIEGSQYILDDWKEHYLDDLKLKPPRIRVSKIEVWESIVACFKYHSFDALDSSAIITFLQKSHGIAHSTGYKILNEVDYLVKKQGGRRAYYNLCDDYLSKKPI